MNPYRRLCRGLDIFVHENYHDVQPGCAAMAKRKYLTEAWNALTPEAKNEYNRKAKHESEVLNELRDASFTELLDSGFYGSLRKTARTTLMRRAALRSLKQMQSHPMWAAGAGLEGFGTGLRPEHVILEKSKERMKIEREDISAFDPRSYPMYWKGRGLQPVDCCARRYQGLCKNDPTLPLVATATNNFHYELSRAKLAKSGPLLVSFHVEPALDCEPKRLYFFTRFFGSGDVALLVEARAVEDESQVSHVALAKVDERIVCSSTYLCFSRLLVDAANARGVGPDDLDSVTFACLKTEIRGGGQYEVRVGGFLLPPTDISCKVRARAKTDKRDAGVELPFGLSYAAAKPTKEKRSGARVGKPLATTMTKGDGSEETSSGGGDDAWSSGEASYNALSDKSADSTSSSEDEATCSNNVIALQLQLWFGRLGMRVAHVMVW